MPAGYSGKSAADKLGLGAGVALLVVDPPGDYAQTIGGLPAGVERVEASDARRADVIHLFCTDADRLAKDFARLAKKLAPGAALWVSWAKKTSPLHRGIDENIVRDVGLRAGLVDVKVCAVNEDWSGLKFLHRRTR